MYGYSGRYDACLKMRSYIHQLFMLYRAAGHIVFEPSLEDTQAVVLSMLEAAVMAASDLPRITPASTTSGVTAVPTAGGAAAMGGGNSGAIPSTGIEEQLVQSSIRVSAEPMLAACAQTSNHKQQRTGTDIHLYTLTDGIGSS